MAQGENSKAMTVEDKLVDKFKNQGLAMLIEDEDAITELARRAIDKALFAEIPDPDDRSSYGRKNIPGVVVTAAREVAKLAAQKVIKEEMEKLTANPNFIQSVREALATALVSAIEHQAFVGIRNISENARIQSHADLVSIINANNLKTN